MLNLAQSLVAAMLAGAATLANGADLVVVVSAKRPPTAMPAQQVVDIFLGNAGRFPDGSEAVPLDLAVGSPLRNEFYARAASRSPALMKAHWTKMIFTGRGQPPREAPGSIAMRKLVADNPSYIGYIDRSALDDSVQAVLVVR